MNNFWIFRAFPYNNNQILHICVRCGGTCFALVHSWLGIRVCLSMSMFSLLTSSCAQRPQRYDILRAVLRVAVRRGLREQATERVVHRTGNLYVFVRDDINLFHINDVRVGCSRLCQEICCGRSSSEIQDQGAGATCCGCSFPHGVHMARIQDQSQVVSWRSWKQPPVETQKPETHSFGPQETTLASTAVITFWLIG